MNSLLQPWIAILVLLHLTSGSKHSEESSIWSEKSRSCPPWFIPNHDDNCTCGSSLNGIVDCNPSNDPSMTILPCYCMTVDQDRNKTVVGNCAYACITPTQWFPDPDELNANMCNERWNRTGQLCAQCMDGCGPLVYSYSLQCVQCSSSRARESLGLLLALFLPLTVFCFIIISLRISGARPPLSTFILVSQVMSAPQYMQGIFTTKSTVSWFPHYISKSTHDNCWKLFATFFGLWNLDIFRAFYPQMCISPHMTTLQVFFLEYAIGLYPLFLLGVTFFLVRLYDRGCRIVFCICRPLCACLAHLRRGAHVRASLIDAFATFVILAQIKIGYTTFLIIQPVYVFSPYGGHEQYVYIDASVKYFQSDHLLYALPALVFSATLVLIPQMLLFLYPLKFFQKCLNNCQWRCIALHTFADAFHGCYKNGTNGTRDYRWFAGLHLLMRFVLVVVYELAMYHVMSGIFMLLCVLFYTAALAILQPYKSDVHLKLDLSLFLGLSLWSTALLIGVVVDGKGATSYGFGLHLAILALSSLIPFAYFVGLIIYWIVVVKKFYRIISSVIVKPFHNGNRIRLLQHSS